MLFMNRKYGRLSLNEFFQKQALNMIIVSTPKNQSLCRNFENQSATFKNETRNDE